LVQNIVAGHAIGAALMFLVLLLSPSPSRAAQDFPRADDSAYARGVLWKVERNGAPASYLLGTLPAADARVAATTSEVRQRLQEAATFIMQVVPDRAAVSAAGDRMLQPRAVDVATTMDPTLYRKVEVAGSRIGVRPEAVRQLKPWAIAALLLLPQMHMENRLESVLHGIAVQQKKPVHGLETLGEQVRQFELLAENDHIELLRYAVDTQHAARTQLMAEAYLQQDLETLALHFGALDAGEGEPAAAGGSFMKRWLEERNAALAERLQPGLATGGAFVAIGAVHLYGGSGVLALLANRGFRVSRVQ